MKALILILILTLASTFGWAQEPERLTIRNGRQAVSKTSGITVRFVELIEDSRCPADVECIWAGVARIKVQVRKNGKTAEFELNTNHRDKPAIFEGYSVGLKSLAPRKTTTSKDRPSAYSATLVISRSGK